MISNGYTYSNPVSRIKTPIVYITPEAKNRLDLLIRYSSIEISGLGVVEPWGDNLLVTEIFLFKQTSSYVSSHLSQEDIAKFMYQMIKNNVDVSKLRLWWHSHCNFQCFWSDEDVKTINLIGQNTDWFLSIVGNQQGEYLCNLDVRRPLKITVSPNLEVYCPTSKIEIDAIIQEIALNVTLLPPKPKTAKGKKQKGNKGESTCLELIT